MTHYLLIALLLNLSSPALQANTGTPDGERQQTTFQNKDAQTSFPEWLSGQLLHRNIPFRVNLATSDYLFSNLAYTDNQSHQVNLVTHFTLTRGGKVENCTVENLSDTAFSNEAKRIITLPGKWNSRDENGKKTASRQTFTVPLDLEGNVVILDKGPEWGEADRKINGKAYNLTRYFHQVAMHIHTKSNDRVKVLEYPVAANFPIMGTLELSFIINEEGYLSNLSYINKLSGIQFEYFVERQMFPGRLFSTEVKWTPAIVNDKPVRVRVKALIDYDKKEFSWNCYTLGK